VRFIYTLKSGSFLAPNFVIAGGLRESLLKRELPVTVPNMKGLWLAALEDLHSMIDAVPDSRIESEAVAIEKADQLKKTMMG